MSLHTCSSQTAGIVPWACPAVLLSQYLRRLLQATFQPHPEGVQNWFQRCNLTSYLGQRHTSTLSMSLSWSLWSPSPGRVLSPSCWKNVQAHRGSRALTPSSTGNLAPQSDWLQDVVGCNPALPYDHNVLQPLPIVPSREGGAAISEGRRENAELTLKAACC